MTQTATATEAAVIAPLTADQLTETHQEIINLNAQYEALKERMKGVKADLESRVKTIPFGQMFQAEDGTVFVVEKPTGTFISFDEWSIKRTRRNGEESSSSRLALKTAEEVGLIVTNKHTK
jgi:hypothetical protein